MSGGLARQAEVGTQACLGPIDIARPFPPFDTVLRDLLPGRLGIVVSALMAEASRLLLKPVTVA